MRAKKAAARLSIQRRIVRLRGEKVILDADLAELYGVETKHLNQATKRNPLRFPRDFAFQLTRAEYARLRSQTVTSKTSRGGRRYAPWAFTEHGAIMAATVLNSVNAIEMSVYVVRAFVGLRELNPMHTKLERKLTKRRRRIGFNE